MVGDPDKDPFTSDLMTVIIPYIQSHYKVSSNPEMRTLAGLSMGGIQTLNIGLTHTVDFRYTRAATVPQGERGPVMRGNGRIFQRKREHFLVVLLPTPDFRREGHLSIRMCRPCQDFCRGRTTNAP